MEDMVGVFHLHPLLIRQECRRSVAENRILYRELHGNGDGGNTAVYRGFSL